MTESTEVGRYAAAFYRDLYGTEHNEELAVAQSFFNGLPKISEDCTAKLEAELSMADLQAALLSLETGKAPGIDRLPVDFLAGDR